MSREKEILTVPTNPREHWIALAVILLGVVLMLAPFIFSRSVPYEDDVAYYYLPAFKYFAEEIREGRVPQIVPEIMSGFPLPLSQVGGFDDSLNQLIFWLLGFPGGYYFRIGLNYFLGGVFMYFFLRKLGCSFGSGLLGAFAYLTAQHIVPGMNILRSNSFFLMPGAFWATASIFHRESRIRFRIFATVVGAFLIGGSLISGYTQLVFYGLIASTAFAAFLFIRHRTWEGIALFSLMMAGGALLAFPHIKDVLEYLPATARAGGLSWEAAGQAGSITALLLNVSLGLLFPIFLYGTLQSINIGVLGLVFASFALRFSLRSPYVLFFTGLFAFSVLASFPYPLFRIMHELPIFSLFRFPPHWLFVASFALATMAALGYQAKPMLGKYFLSFFALLNLILPAWWLAAEHSAQIEALQETPWVVHRIREKESSLREFRVFSLFGGGSLYHLFVKPYKLTESEKISLAVEVSPPNLSHLYFGIQTITAADNFAPRRYQKLINYVEMKPLTDHINETKTALKIPERLIEVLGMMGVKYFWSNIPIPEEFLGRSAAQLEVRRIPGYSIPQILYRNERFIPKIHTPKKIQIFPENEAENLERMISAEPPFNELGFIECRGCTEEVVQNSQMKILVEKDEPEHIILKTSSNEAGWVIVSVLNIPGWVLTIDGAPAPIQFANYAYQGIKVLSGEHVIHLQHGASK